MNPDNETGVINCVLKKPETFTNLNDILKPKHFNHVPYQWMWEAIKTVSDEGLRVDALTVSDELERMGKLTEFSYPGNHLFGRVAISEIRKLDASTQSAESYAYNVTDEYAKRQLKLFGTQVVNEALNGRRASDIIADFETKTSSLFLYSGKVENHSYNMESALENAQKATEDAATGTNVFESGIKDLDEIISVQNTELITIAAPTSQGKTAFLATIVLNSARKGKKWLVFTLEGGHVPFTQRLISQASGVEAWRIMKGRIKEDEYPVYKLAIEELKNLNIQVIDIPSIRIGQMKIQARKKDYDCIGVDYVQLARSDKKNDRRDLDIGEITSGLKAVAMELNIPVFQLAQINRSVESRADRKPGLYDLRESGSIENDSDTVIFIYRPDQTNINATQFIVAKHRNGALGTADAYFKEGIMRFENAVTNYIDGKSIR